MTRRRSALLFQYRLLVALLFPVLAIHAAWLAIKWRNPRFFRERVGFTRGPSADVWIHAASVGEVNAALPLVRLLAARQPAKKILFTTTTLSGADAVADQLPMVKHRFLPLDRAGGVGRFLDGCRPRYALIVETELWPNLYAACSARAIPLIIVNGRLSARTLSAPAWVRNFYRECLSNVRGVLARSAEDGRRFIALGATAERVQVVGSLKFAAAPRTSATTPVVLGRPYVLAASTRDGEERLLMEAWERAQVSSHLLVIVPRHPHRVTAILADLRGRSVSVRSRGETITTATAVYLADTFGELTTFMAGADLVFMGGSLVPKGGQNLLEAAALGKAIVTGPHMENFAEETETLRMEGGLVQVRDLVELQHLLRELPTDSARRRHLGDNARRVVDARRDVAERYADAVERICGSAK